MKRENYNCESCKSRSNSWISVGGKIPFDPNIILIRERDNDMKIKPDQNAVTMIQELSDAKAPSGFEDEAVAVAKKYGAEFADVEEDCLRNLYLRSKNNTGNKPVFMLDLL